MAFTFVVPIQQQQQQQISRLIIGYSSFVAVVVVVVVVGVLLHAHSFSRAISFYSSNTNCVPIYFLFPGLFSEIIKRIIEFKNDN